MFAANAVLRSQLAAPMQSTAAPLAANAAIVREQRA
jgi:hypothetical protein